MTATRHPSPGPSQHSILVVEDDRDILEMMTLYLEFCGYVVHAASDGLDAIDMAVRVHPRIILMDLMMPLMDGWEATRQLKADARTRDITIVALSARAQGDDDHSAQHAGCDAFLPKPCNLDQLSAMLREFFDGRFHPWTPTRY